MSAQKPSQKQPIGFSTGCVYKSRIPLGNAARLFRSIGANAIELNFATPDELFSCSLSPEVKEEIMKFDFVSIHAPFKDVRYGSNPGIGKVMDKLRWLCAELPVEGLVLHINRVDDFDFLVKSGLPFLIENMDRRKAYGIHPDHISELKTKYAFRFVFDIQHAYEHDSSMKLAKELLTAMGDRLAYMHVSGSTETEIHFPLSSASNRDAITAALGFCPERPIILEGILLGTPEEIKASARKELDYVRACKAD